MQPSPIGLLVCCAVLAIGHYARGTIVVGLIVSLAFGSTAALILSALGGASPLIYTMFSALLITAVAARRGILKEMGQLFARVPDAAVLCFLMVYAVVGAVMLPRLFAGQTTAFAKPSGSLAIIETSLAPVSGNITQTGYLVLNALTALALCVLLLNGRCWDQVRRGFVIFAALTVGFGVLDLAGKMLGAGDVLAPIRTANYALLTESSEGRFYRIVGAFPEASSFATAALACLAFTYTYWRRTGERLMLYLWLALAGLLTLSTSSTAYVGLAGLLAVALAAVGRSILADRMQVREALIVGLFALGFVVALAIALRKEGFFDPFLGLVDSMVLDKASSDSGRERAYWNTKSIQALRDTVGLGIGVGSSRASSWPVAVLSQLGVIGSLVMARLTLVLLSGLKGIRASIDPQTETLVASVRASALASLLALSLVGGAPDPGTLYFIALAVVVAARATARSSRPPRLSTHPLAGRG